MSDEVYAEARHVARYLAFMAGELPALPDGPLRDMQADTASALAERFGMPPVGTPPDGDLLAAAVAEVLARLREADSEPFTDRTSTQGDMIVAGLPFTYAELVAHAEETVQRWMPTALDGDGSPVHVATAFYTGGIIAGALAQQFRR